MLKQKLKKAFLGSGRRGRRIPFGLYRGLTLSIDPASEMGLWLGSYEAETTPWLRKVGTHARSMVDVGSGYGEMTAWALHQPNMEQVLAYDSKAQRWAIFRENMRLNGFADDSRLKSFEGYFLASKEDSHSLGLLESMPEPILFKIDIDGGEELVLTNMRPLLASRRCMLLVETHSEQLDAACGNILRSAGYHVQSIGPAWWRSFVRERRPIGFNQWIVAEQPAGVQSATE